MRSSLMRLGFVAVAASIVAQPTAQTARPITIHVTETAGIRRSSYPVNARVHLAPGELSDPSHARLLSGGREIPAQITAEARDADGSIQWLDVDFNVSLGPREAADYALEFGNLVKPGVEARGLTVTQDAGGIQIGSVRLGLTGAPLLASVRYRREDIGTGANGFAVMDDAGAAHGMSSSRQTKVEVLKRGPLYVTVRYSGELPLTERSSVQYTTTVEMPNSKTWVKTTTAIEDPARQIRELSFHTPLALGPSPWTWDFGTGSWSYGVIRNPNESAALTQFVGRSQATRWEIRFGPKTQEQLVETGAGRRPQLAEGWGHVQDPSEAVAFAIPGFGAQPGIYAVTIDGAGQLSFRWTPERPSNRVELTVYEHFVATPVPIGAITSPVSMLNPLVVSVSNASTKSAGSRR